MLFQIIEILYWLALSTWFGGVLFVSVMAPIILRTLQEENPILPQVLSVNLEGQHASLLSGAVVGNIRSMLARIELGCAAVLLLCLIAQWFLVDRSRLVPNLVRSALYLAAVVFIFYDWRVVWPLVWKHRQEYIDHADEPEVANPARDRFNQYSRLSVTLLGIVLALLLGIIVYSSGLTPATTTYTFGTGR